MPWSTPFPEPIELPDGRKLHTIEQAARFIQKLPTAQHDQPHWRDAVEHLLRASGSPAWLMFADMFMLKALHHGKPKPEKEPRRKRVKAFKIVRAP